MKPFTNFYKSNVAMLHLTNTSTLLLPTQKTNVLIRSLFIVALGILLSFQANAQEYQFKVLANQGENALITSDGSINEHLKVGSILQEGDKLILGEGAYVGLMHPNGRTMELKEAGEFEVSSLVQQAGEGNSVASKYANYLINKMSEEDVDIHANHTQYLKVTGAVERALDSSAIKVMLPNSAEIFNPNAFVKWTDLGEASYVVTMRNMFDEVLLTQETSKPQIEIDLNANELANEKLVIIKVTVKDNPALASDNYGIKKIAAPKAKTINSDLKSLKASFQEESGLNKLILASFYEDHNLLVDALANYEEALMTNPDVEEYRTAYERFVTRHNLLN